MDEEKRKAKNQYNIERITQLRKDKIIKTFSVDMPYEEMEEINHFLSQSSYTKKDIVRAGYKALRNKKEYDNMKKILMEIADILYQIPNMNRDTMGSIINPIDTMEEAKKMLEYLQKNKENLKTGYLIKHRMEIIGK